MKIHEIIGETFISEMREATLFHGLHPHYAIQAFIKDALEGHTAHSSRKLMLDGGKPPYQVKGLSLSRTYRVSSKFGSVIFEFDRLRLSSRYRIVPIADMGFAGRGFADEPGGHEAEEFLVGNIAPLSNYLVAIHVLNPYFERQYKSFGKPPKEFLESPLIRMHG